MAIKNTAIVEELSLPPVKVHCSVLAEDAIKAAIKNFQEKQASRQARGRRRTSRLSGRTCRDIPSIIRRRFMATVTEPETIGLKTDTPPAAPPGSPSRQRRPTKSGGSSPSSRRPARAEKMYLRMRVVGGGCSGFQHKLDLDTIVNPKLDEVFEAHGVEVVVDKRSLLYLNGVTVDYHNDLNRRGFSMTNPQAKSTCGCGSSFSM